MDTAPLSRAVSRRRALQYSTGAAASVALAFGGLRGAAQAKTAKMAAYRLDPEWGAGLAACPIPHLGGQGCHACEACHGHSVKLFTSAPLANRTRAHKYCKCLVRRKQLTMRKYLAAFGPPAGPLHRDEFDPRRDEPLDPHQVFGT